jgi:hypothetical protein
MVDDTLSVWGGLLESVTLLVTVHLRPVSGMVGERQSACGL